MKSRVQHKWRNSDLRDVMWRKWIEQNWMQEKWNQIGNVRNRLEYVFDNGIMMYIYSKLENDYEDI